MVGFKGSGFAPEEIDKYREPPSTRLLELPTKTRILFGRDQELEVLKLLYEDIVPAGAQSRVSMVHGMSGVGKTALVEMALSRITASPENTCFVAQGKYDQFVGPSSRHSAIIDAFNKLGHQIADSGKYEQEMKKALAFEGALLTQLIPSFAKYRQSDDSDGEHDGEELLDSLVLASGRLLVAFLSFLKWFCKVCPLVIFLDDLQWADRISSSLVASVLNDDELENFLFIGGYRDDDLTMIQPFLEEITRPYTSISLNELSEDSVGQLLYHLLRTDQANIESLSRVLCRKTGGNVYFVLQQLQLLQSQKLLVYNFALRRWEWDIAEVSRRTVLSENVVDVVTGRIKALPLRTRNLLEIASCLDYSVEIDLLLSLESCLQEERIPSTTSNSTDSSLGTGIARESLSLVNTDVPKRTSSDDVVVEDDLCFEKALACAEDIAFIERVGPCIKFSHDRIQQSFYELSEVGKSREMLHFRLGENLRSQFEQTSETRFLLLAVEQLNRSSSMLTKDGDIISLIRLNLEASRVTKQKAGIEAVSGFLRKAVDLTQPTFWQSHYRLILEVYTASAEVDFSLGLEGSEESVNIIIRNAQSEVDKVRAMVVRLQIYGHRCQFKDAIQQAREVMKLLGERMPATNTFNVLKEFFLAKRDARKKSDAFFVNLPPTSNDSIRTALKVLQITSVYGWNGDTLYAGLAFLRAIRLTIREGSSEATSFIYSGFGFMLAEFGDEEQGFRFGQLALEKTSRSANPSSAPLTYCSLLHLRLPVHLSLEPLLTGYRAGLATGDLFFGTICIASYTVVYVSCALPLAPLAVDMRHYMSQLKICRQDVPLAFLLPTCQFAWNLMGKSNDPLDLTSEAIKRDQAEFCNERIALEERDDAPSLYMSYLRVFTAFILEAEDEAENSIRAIYKKKETRLGGTHIMNYFLNFVDGVTGFRLLRKSRKDRFAKRLAKRAISVLKKWSKTKPVNSISILALLEAESASLSKMATMDTKKLYDDAISQFARSGLLHYGAIANELAGLYMLRKQDMYWAKYYLNQACSLYSDWNAYVKVQQMVEKFDFVRLTEGGSSRNSFAVYGKSRFSLERDAINQHDSKALTSTDFKIARGDVADPS